jgi:hypothetical protein
MDGLNVGCPHVVKAIKCGVPVSTPFLPRIAASRNQTPKSLQCVLFSGLHANWAAGFFRIAMDNGHLSCFVLFHGGRHFLSAVTASVLNLKAVQLENVPISQCIS